MKTVNRKDHEDGTRFVRLVKQHPCLYNYQCEDYTKREAIEEAWKQIGAELKLDPNRLKDRWRNFRTVFLRRCKAQAKGKPIRSNYYLTNEMSFLLPYVKVSVPLQDSPSYYEANSSSSSFATDKRKKDQQQDKSPDVQYAIVLPKEDKDYQDNTDQSFEEASAYVTTTPIANKSSSMSQQQEAEFVEYTSLKQETVSVSHATTLESTDPRRLFIYSILPDTEKMTAKQFRKFRKLCLDFIDTCEEDD